MLQGEHALRRKLGVRSALIAGVAATAVCLPAAPALAQTGPVSPTPVAGTPTLVATGTTEEIRQIADCGGNMYAVGTFTQISGWNGSSTQTFTRNRIFRFSDASPFTVDATWDPNVNGTVNTIAFSGGDCSHAYIGGQFTSVGGTAVKNIAEIDTTTGAVVPAFKSNSSGQVETILAVNGHLLTGGFFKGINGSTTDPYYISLNPATGKDDGFVHLNISGHIVFPGVKNNSTEVFNQQLSHGGTLVLVEGDYTSVGGQNRRQIFMIDVSGATATLTGWTSPEFDGSDPNATLNANDKYFNCGASHPFYIHAAAWSPDDSEIYIADTGVKPILWDGKTFPLPGLCDAAAAFPATQSQVFSDWIAYDGCDSLYSAVADSSALYVSGHNRWFNNQNACNKAGPGAIPAPGLAGLTPGPTGGSLILNSAGTAGLYSRSRGHGSDDMILAAGGLWIASDNFGGGTSCGGQAGFSGLCFLPYPS
ncbi:MAG TPA: hypothetical protein VFJ07_10685 [Streptosporangiaceae bacterium]|nr:hypothetical protein [Streptosporangiaceae bacterium]